MKEKVNSKGKVGQKIGSRERRRKRRKDRERRDEKGEGKGMKERDDTERKERVPKKRERGRTEG